MDRCGILSVCKPSDEEEFYHAATKSDGGSKRSSLQFPVTTNTKGPKYREY